MENATNVPPTPASSQLPTQPSGAQKITGLFKGIRHFLARSPSVPPKSTTSVVSSDAKPGSTEEKVVVAVTGTEDTSLEKKQPESEKREEMVLSAGQVEDSRRKIQIGRGPGQVSPSSQDSSSSSVEETDQSKDTYEEETKEMAEGKEETVGAAPGAAKATESVDLRLPSADTPSGEADASEQQPPPEAPEVKEEPSPEVIRVNVEDQLEESTPSKKCLLTTKKALLAVGGLLGLIVIGMGTTFGLSQIKAVTDKLNFLKKLSIR